MSEYQSYEFLAIDRPLTAKQMAELRAISSRADISPTRFWNEYQWGDLKADPAKLMERYFDAHVYFANWGTHRLMLRLPLARVDLKSLRPYFAGDVARARISRAHVVLDLHTEDEESDYDEVSHGSLAALAQLRAELIRGDLRVAYLAWLLAVQAGDVDDANDEPPLPPGLTELSAAQEAMVDFLRIDGDLLAASAKASREAPDDRDGFRRWVSALLPRAKDQWLLRAAADPDLALGGELLRAFRATSKSKRKLPRRTVGELRAAADARRAARDRAQSAREEKAKRAADAARTGRLGALANRLDEAWRELERLIDQRAYDEAFRLALDLREVGDHGGRASLFVARFDALRKRLLRRRGFFDRWKREREQAEER